MFKDTKNHTKDCLKLAIFCILLENCIFLRLFRESITIFKIKNCLLSEKKIYTICNKTNIYPYFKYLK